MILVPVRKYFKVSQRFYKFYGRVLHCLSGAVELNGSKVLGCKSSVVGA